MAKCFLWQAVHSVIYLAQTQQPYHRMPNITIAVVKQAWIKVQRKLLVQQYSAPPIFFLDSFQDTLSSMSPNTYLRTSL